MANRGQKYLLTPVSVMNRQADDLDLRCHAAGILHYLQPGNSAFSFIDSRSLLPLAFARLVVISSSLDPENQAHLLYREESERDLYRRGEI